VLGELRVYRDGELIALPQSKKARALLGYLVVTRRAQRRERLANLLWDVTDDSRGALRWTLSRVRAAIDAPGQPLLAADRDEVRFEHGAAWTDRFGLPPVTASVAELEEAASWFHGELLEGCDLPDFFEFSAWLSAEREEARRQRQRLLTALSNAISEPERALVHARALVQVDPLDEAAGTRLLKLLLRSGRRAEAEEHCDSVARLLESVGQTRAPWLASMRAELRASSTPPLGSVQPPPVAPSWEEAPFVGRERELEVLLTAARADRPTLVLVSGDPGIGKSRLLAEASRRLGAVLEARAFEADRNLPFLPWQELLRGLPGATDDAELAPLSSAQPAPPSSSREGLFRAVTRALSTARVLVFDDAQWLDDASLTLLHHVLRARSAQPLVCLLGARRGELSDNPALVSLIRGARRDRWLTELALEPLGAADVEALAVAVGAKLAPERIARESEGSPLFALELSRWSPHLGAELPATLRELVAERLERLPRPEQELLGWAATLGGHFEVEVLRELCGFGPEQLLRSLELLERHALLCASPSAPGRYRVAHELLARAIYLGISEPRRKLMHRRVAELLSARDVGSAPAVDVSRHAALAGDSELAAEFCLRAARRCARLFANDEARAFAQRGLQHAAVLEERRRVPLEIELQRAAVMARRPTDVEPVVATLLELAERALDLGHADEARSAYRMISQLHWEVGRFTEAERANAQVETVGRAAGFAERARALGEAGHCLAVLERDLPRAEALLLEARALCSKASLELFVVNVGFGLLHRFRGEAAEAARLFTAARARARLDGDRSSEFDALAQLVELSFQSGDWAAAERDSDELLQLGARLPEGSEPAFSRGLSALLRYASDAGARGELEQCLEELRVRDATHRLATLLIYAAELELRRGEAASAAERSRRAAALAENLQRDSDVVVARTLAAQADAALRQGSDHELLSTLRAAESLHLSARAQRALAQLP
jgi:DNA-binding SARP family transcriptional activator/tetratricopeptide (TPR) repeat protein